jgi:hypothetical protein
VGTNTWAADAQPLIDAGLVEVDRAASRFFGRLWARFPIGLNRIDWSRVAAAVAVPCPDPKPTVETYAPKVAGFLARVVGWTGVAQDERAVLLGDAADVALWLTIPILQAHAGRLLRAPQHYYLLPPDAGWCFSYTFEDDMYFGWAVQKEGAGRTTRYT